MSFLEAGIVSSLINQPRLQPEGLLKVSQRKAHRLGIVENMSSGRVSRGVGSNSEFQSTSSAVSGEWKGIRFRADGDGSVDNVYVPLKKLGTIAGTATASIFDDVDGLPDTIISGASDTRTLNSAVATASAMVKFAWSANAPVLTLGTHYWVVVKTTDFVKDTGKELYLSTDATGDSEVASYDSNGTPLWLTDGVSVGANVVVCINHYEVDDSIIGSMDDGNKYALFASAKSPIEVADVALTITGKVANSGRVTRGTGVNRYFQTTGGDSDGEWYGIKFTARATISAVTVQVPLIRLGTPGGTVMASIYSVVAGLPGVQTGSDSPTVTISSGVGLAMSYITFTWSSTKPSLVKDTDYFVVIKTTGYTYSVGTNYIALGTDVGGSSEVFDYESDGSPTWTTAGATIGANVKVGGTAIVGTATLAKLSGLDTAELVLVSGLEAAGWGSVESVAINVDNPGGFETIELWAIPEVDAVNFERLVFFRSADFGGGAIWMPVPDCFDAVYATCMVRRTNTVTITKDYVLYTDLAKYAGKQVTAIIELHPAGSGIVAEYMILANCTLSANQNMPDNAMIVASVEGGYSALLIYTP